MLDVSPVLLTREATAATALVTRVADEGLEVRVWPPEDVWSVARSLDREGLVWDAALPDESGLPGSLVVCLDGPGPDVDLAALVTIIDGPGVAALGYHPVTSDPRGAWQRLPGSEPEGRDRVVFVELQESGAGERWQVRAFGPVKALQRLHDALAELALARPVTLPPERAVSIELGAGAGTVQDVVTRLDAAGLDGHVRVLRRQPHA